MPQAVPYTPKENHPWRRYRNRPQKNKVPQKSRLYPFLKELVENWDEYDLGLRDNFSSGRIKYMPDSTVAIWLADHINRNFAINYYEEEQDNE